MSHTRMDQRGRITLPKAVRERLGLRPGDAVVFVTDEHGRVRLEHGGLTLEQLLALLPRARRRLSLAGMDRAIAWGARGGGRP